MDLRSGRWLEVGVGESPDSLPRPAQTPGAYVLAWLGLLAALSKSLQRLQGRNTCIRGARIWCSSLSRAFLPTLGTYTTTLS